MKNVGLLRLISAAIVCHLFFALTTSAQENNLVPNAVQTPNVVRSPLDNTVQTIMLDGQTKSEDIKFHLSQYLGIYDKRVSMVAAGKTLTKQGTTVQRYQQYYKGIKVEFSSCAVLSREGMARMLESNVYDVDTSLSIGFELGQPEALTKAIASVKAEKYMWEEQGMERLLKHETNKPDTSYFPRATLVWVEKIGDKQPDRKLHLAYRFDIYSLKPFARQVVYVDTRTGEILFTNQRMEGTLGNGNSLYSGPVSFQAGHFGSNYLLYDSTRGGGINTYSLHNTSGSSFTEVTSTGTTFATDASIDAHWGAEKVYDYWQNVQGRNSYDGMGGPINSYTHLLTGYDNAYWDGSHMVYGDGSGISSGGFSPLVSLDVCAHEIGHGVCQYTADLIYSKESGAMNEGFSDIWGAVIENYANPHEIDAVAKDPWKLGEEISSSSLRRMDNPNLKGQPDTYSGTYWTNLTGCAPYYGNDYCGVHTNSGVLNYWFYLLTTGGTGTNDLGHAFSVTGIGFTEAANIAYQTELILTSTASFASCRTASINVATILYGSCSPEVVAVTQAWYAVGVGSAFSMAADPIVGSFAPCMGTTMALSNPGSTGTWVSSNTGVATIGSSSGIVTGVSVGTTIITYTVGIGCTATKVVTVNQAASAITGTLAICAGATSSLACSPSGGTWSTADNTIATIAGSTGVLSGGGSGTTIASYFLPTGCRATATVTVNAVASIIGAPIVCPSSVTMFSSTTPGGTWSSSVPGIATVDATGTVTGVSAGTSLISYTLTGSCGTVATNRIVTVNPSPSAGTLSGPNTVCAGFSITLSSTVSGGTWSTADSDKIVLNNGRVTGYVAGTATITYSDTNSCGTAIVTDVVTVTVSPVADVITTIAGTGAAGYDGDGGLATAAKLKLPFSIVFDDAGNLYVGQDSSVIRKITPAGIITTIAGTTGKGHTGDGGLATMAQIGTPVGLSRDKAGNMFFCDGNFDIARKINAFGIITHFAFLGDTATGHTGDGGPAVSARGTDLSACAVDSHGNVYFPSYQDHCIRKVDTAGIITTIAGNSLMAGHSGDGGPATLAQMNGPIGVFVDRNDNIYIAEHWGNVIRRIDPAGIISTVAGTGVAGFSGDGGPATAAQLNIPFAVTADTLGNLYIGEAEDGNNCIRKVNTSGIITTITGFSSVAGHGYNGDMIPAISAKVASPIGLRVGPDNLLYFADMGNNRVRKIMPAPPLPEIPGVVICTGVTTTMGYVVTGGTWSSSNPSVATIGSLSGAVSGIAGGTTTMTYSLNNGCGSIFATTVVTVNQTPVITGPTAICPGTSATFISATAGAWSSSNPSVATVNASGLVTGVAAGTAVIYCVTAQGCNYGLWVNVVSTLPAIGGAPTDICAGNTTSLSHTYSGGTWSSSNTSLATVSPSGTGWAVVTGASAGVVKITYSLGSGCFTTADITVDPTPTAIAGSASVCVGTTSTMTNSLSGGSWSYVNTGKLTIGTATGIVTGVMVGTNVITYTMPITGCKATKTVTVLAAPTAAINGSTPVCAGASVTLSDLSTGGSWTSGSPAVATVGTTSGIVQGITAGTSTISYSFSSGCFKSVVVTVNTQPVPITGPGSACVGTPITLSNSTAGGSWSESAANISVGTTGIVTSTGAGTATVTYTMPVTGCKTMAVLTINVMPAVISGKMETCTGLTTTLNSSTTGGAWTSTNEAVASVSGGVVTGAGVGTATISYALGTGCGRAAVVTVDLQPAPITGTSAICVGSIITLANSTPGGTWSKASPSITMTTSGVVTASLAGTAIVSYKMPSGCNATTVVTVNPTPTGIAGTLSLCEGATTTVSNSVTGGTWSSSSPATATVDASGVVNGLVAGTTTINYVLAGGCSRTAIVTVNVQPGPISGPTNLCIGSPATLSNSVSGGTFQESSPNVSMNSAGVINGVAVGTAIVSYKMASGCYSTEMVTVDAAPAAITGTMTMCAGSNTTLNNTVAGGTWSSSNGVIATVGTDGVVSGVVAGTATITYAVSAGCYRTATVTVNAQPSSISGPSNICIGTPATMSNSVAGGSWLESSPNISITSGGVVTGTTAGTAIITYKMSTGCNAMVTVTVGSLPAVITGTMTVCAGMSTTLGNSFSGGAWSSSNPAVASVSGTGEVSGIIGGTSMISYSMGAGCVATAAVTVNAQPAAITGVGTICIGLTTTLSSSTTGGTWSESSPDITVSATGVVTGVAAGTAVVTYTIGSGCRTTTIVTVNTVATPITGATTVCVGQTATLENVVSGGTWSSSDATVASIGSASGIVTGNAAGTALITYTIAAGCSATSEVTVSPLPTAITGAGALCVGSTVTLNSTTAGGTWTSSDATKASIDVAGELSGLSAGTSDITYTLGTGCATTAAVTVNPLPAAITGGLTMCSGSVISLADGTPGGTWISANTAVAPIGSTSGIITGTSAGTSAINYLLSTGCSIAVVVTVTASPAAISGDANICIGVPATLSNSTSSGIWSSSAPAVASVGGGSGIVTGVITGTATISYSIGSCVTTIEVTVGPVIPVISGPPTVLIGATITLSASVNGGTWSASSGNVGVDATGIVTGVTAGSSVVSYTLTTSCGIVVATQTVNVTGGLLPVSGTLEVCEGSGTTLGDVTPGGAWSSDNTSVATVSADGLVTGVAQGTATISYTVSGGSVVAVVTVNALPAILTGTMRACAGTATTISSATTGGTWTSSDTGVADIDASGVVTGVSPGTATITYSNIGCSRTAMVTIDPIPAAIEGQNLVCTGSATALTDATPGLHWTIDNTSVATVGYSTGIVAGVTAGTAVVSYGTPGASCIATKVITVSSAPAVTITGPATSCTGSTVTLSASVGGGTWSCSAPDLASIDSVTGAITIGGAGGTVTITYTLGTGCYKTKTIGINTGPAVTGYPIVCTGLTTTLSGGSYGTWTSANPAVATVAISGGYVTGVAPGTVAITYTSTTSTCVAIAIVTVIPVPSASTGPAILCSGQSAVLSNSTPGGVWSSSNTAVATVDAATGAVTAVGSGGTVTITYAFGKNCRVNSVITLKPIPAVIGGTYSVCATMATTLSDVTSGGTWSSGNTAVATIGTGASAGYGVVSGLVAGTTTISYTLTSTGCARTAVVTVNACSRPGGNEQTEVGSVQLYPNPTTGAFTLVSEEAGVLNVFSVDGREIASYTIAAGINPLNLPREIAPGIYMCKYTNESGNTTIVRLVVER